MLMGYTLARCYQESVLEAFRELSLVLEMYRGTGVRDRQLARQVSIFTLLLRNHIHWQLFLTHTTSPRLLLMSGSKDLLF